MKKASVVRNIQCRLVLKCDNCKLKGNYSQLPCKRPPLVHDKVVVYRKNQEKELTLK